jgi:hypothetical protein
LCADLSARAEMMAVRWPSAVATNIADDEEDLVLMGKPLDKLDAELLILTHPP